MTTNYQTEIASQDDNEGISIADAKEQIQEQWEAGPAAPDATDEMPTSESAVTDEPEASEPDTSSKRTSNEAAKYRRQLREVEAERDELTTQLDQSRRMLLGQELNKHTIGGDGGTWTLHPAALADVTLPAAAFDGLTIKRDEVKSFLQALHETKPYMFVKVSETLRSTQPRTALRGGSKPYDEPAPRPKFTNAFKPSA